MFDDVALTASDLEARDRALAALEMAYPKGPPSASFQSFKVPGLMEGQEFLVLVSVERRRWSKHHHFEMKVILGELDQVNLPFACSVAGALRGGVVMHEQPPYFVFYRESWPLPELDPQDVVQAGQGLAWAAGLYRS